MTYFRHLMKSLNLQILSYLIISLFLLSACDRDKLPADVLAEVGGQQITLDDFKRAYLPVLLYSDKKESPQTREEILNFLYGLPYELERSSLFTFEFDTEMATILSYTTASGLGFLSRPLNTDAF